MTKAEAAWVRAKLLETMVRIRQTATTGKCAICGHPVAHWQDTGEPRMVCSNPKCFTAWLLPGHKEIVTADDHEDTQVLAAPDDEIETTTPTAPQSPIPF